MSKENNPNLTEMIREIHDGVAREMYCKGIDDFVKFANTMPTIETKDGTIRPMWLEEIAEELKGSASCVSNDVCECRRLKDCKSLFKTSCGYIFAREGFKYCPYCGKKIKVVE